MSKLQTLVKGIVVPTLTVFRDDAAQSIDDRATAAHVEWLIGEGVDAVVPGGSSGEFPALSIGETKHLFDVVIEAARGRVPIYASVGRYSTRETIELALYARAVGAQGGMVVLPYYMRPPIDDVIAHFRELRTHLEVGAEFPIILYNNPGTCGYELSRADVEALWRRGIIAGVKASQGPAEAAWEIARIPDPPRVYYGHDYDAYRAKDGAHGWLSGILNVFPSAARTMWRGGPGSALPWEQQGAKQLATRIWGKGLYHPVTAYKAALAILGRDVGVPRRPLRPLSAEQYRDLEALLDPAREGHP